jgi:Family of unknown function (DUF6286)
VIRRPRRTLPATIVALVLLAVCVLVVVAVAQALLGQTPFLSLDQLLAVTAGQHWNSAATVAAAVVLAVIGLVLLAAAIRPGRPTVLPLAPQEVEGRPGADAGVRRATLAKDLTTTVEAVAGVTRAEVTARRRRVTASVEVAAAEPAAVPDQVRERLEARLSEIGPAPRPRVRVHARPDRHT